MPPTAAGIAHRRRIAHFPATSYQLPATSYQLPATIRELAIDHRKSLGLPRGTVGLRPYDPEWPELFEQERRRIAEVLGPLALGIEHVGSTSVPGMLSKPILDIAVAVADFDVARVSVPALELAGYTWRGELGIPRRHYFRRGDPRTHHLHMLEITSDDWRNHIRFRDSLRSDPEVAAAYVRLKQNLGKRFPTDREAYTNGKAEFIRRVLNDENRDRFAGIGS